MRRAPSIAALALIVTPLVLAQDAADEEAPLVLGGRVAFLIDASGSMAIGGRFSAAKAKVLELVDGLDEGARVQLFLFHDEARPCLKGRFRQAGRATRRKLAAILAEARPRLGSGADLKRALTAALEGEPDTIVLISDGMPGPGQARD